MVSGALLRLDAKREIERFAEAQAPVVVFWLVFASQQPMPPKAAAKTPAKAMSVWRVIGAGIGKLEKTKRLRMGHAQSRHLACLPVAWQVVRACIPFFFFPKPWTHWTRSFSVFKPHALPISDAGGCKAGRQGSGEGGAEGGESGRRRGLLPVLLDTGLTGGESFMLEYLKETNHLEAF